jgi:hypothetical protein
MVERRVLTASSSLRDMQIFPFVARSDASLPGFAMVLHQRDSRAMYPYGEELGISPHKLVVLVRMDYQTLAIGKDEASDRLRMD